MKLIKMDVVQGTEGVSLNVMGVDDEGVRIAGPRASDGRVMHSFDVNVADLTDAIETHAFSGSTSGYDFISVDIETLGTYIDSSIIQLGVCLCIANRYFTQSVFLKPDYSRADADTLEWWNTQPNKDIIFGAAETKGVADLDHAWGIVLNGMRDYINEKNLPLVKFGDLDWWFRGPQFDEAMLRYQGPTFWKYSRVDDQRSLTRLMDRLGYPREDHETPPVGGSKHDAAFDAEMQARSINSCLKLLSAHARI